MSHVDASVLAGLCASYDHVAEQCQTFREQNTNLKNTAVLEKAFKTGLVSRNSREVLRQVT